MRDRLKFNFWAMLAAINFVNILVPGANPDFIIFTTTTSLVVLVIALFQMRKIAWKNEQ